MIPNCARSRQTCVFLLYMHPESKPPAVWTASSTTVAKLPSWVKPAEREIRLSAYPCTTIRSRGEDFNSCNQGPRRRPKACVLPRTQFGNPNTPLGSQGPFQAGGQAPPSTERRTSRQGAVSRHARADGAGTRSAMEEREEMCVNMKQFGCGS